MHSTFIMANQRAVPANFRDFTYALYNKKKEEKKKTHITPAVARREERFFSWIVAPLVSPSPLPPLSVGFGLRFSRPGARQVADTCIDLFRVRVDRG